MPAIAGYNLRDRGRREADVSGRAASTRGVSEMKKNGSRTVAWFLRLLSGS